MKAQFQQQRQYGGYKQPISSLPQSPQSALIFHSDFHDNSDCYQPFKSVKQSGQFFNFFTKPSQQFPSFTDRSQNINNNSINKNKSASNITVKVPTPSSQPILTTTPYDEIKWRPTISSTCRKSQQEKSLATQNSMLESKPIIQKAPQFQVNSNYNTFNSLNIQGHLINRTHIEYQKSEQFSDRKQQQQGQDNLINKNYYNIKSLHQTTSNPNLIGYQNRQQLQQQPINNVLFHSQSNTPRNKAQAVQFPVINTQDRTNAGQLDDQKQDIFSFASPSKAGNNNKPLIISKKIHRNEGTYPHENLMIRGKSAVIKSQQKQDKIEEPNQMIFRCQSAISQSQSQQQSESQNQINQTRQLLSQYNSYRQKYPNNSQIICRKTIHGLKKREPNNTMSNSSDNKDNITNESDIPESITAFKRISSPSKNLPKDNLEEDNNIFEEFHNPMTSNSSSRMQFNIYESQKQEDYAPKTRSFRELPNISAEKIGQLQIQSQQVQSNDNNTNFSQNPIETNEPVLQTMNYKEKIWNKIIQERKRKQSQIQGTTPNTNKDESTTNTNTTNQFGHVKLPSFSAISSPMYCSVDPVGKYDNFELFVESTLNLNSSTNASSCNQIFETIPSINFESFCQKEDQQQKYEFTLEEYGFEPLKEHELQQFRKEQLKILPQVQSEKRATIFEQEDQQYLITPRLAMTISFGNTLE